MVMISGKPGGPAVAKAEIRGVADDNLPHRYLPVVAIAICVLVNTSLRSQTLFQSVGLATKRTWIRYPAVTS